MILSKILRDLADAIDSGDYFAPRERPEGFIPAGGPMPELGPGEALYAWNERTGETVVRITRDRLRIERPTVLAGYVRGPRPESPGE